MEERKVITKRLYKAELLLLKFIPMLLALLYFLNTVLPYCDIDCRIFNYLGGLSLIPMIFLYVSYIIPLLEDMTQSLMETRPFTLDTGILGDIEIGNGLIKLNIPMIEKTITFNMQDINKLKQMLTM